MIREIIRVILQPIKAVLSIFNNDAHYIISKRGIEVLENEKAKNDYIHDVMCSCCKSNKATICDKCNSDMCVSAAGHN